MSFLVLGPSFLGVDMTSPISGRLLLEGILRELRMHRSLIQGRFSALQSEALRGACGLY